MSAMADRMRTALQGLRRRRGGMLAGAGALLLAATVLPPVQLQRTVVNHLAVIDITQSMYVGDQMLDGKAVSRLEFTRQALIRAMEKLPCGSRLGIGIFASRRTLLLLAPVEVCANRTELAQAIGQIDARMAWEDASVIARGVYSATDVAFELTSHPSVIFITDGQESPPMATIPEFDRPPGRIKGMLLGVGGDTPQPIPRIDKKGRQIGWWSANAVVQQPTPAGFAPNQEHLSAVHEQHLQGLAQAAGLGYARLADTAGLEQVLATPELARTLTVATDLRSIPALLALLLLVLHYLQIPPSWRHRGKKMLLPLLSALLSWLRVRTRMRPGPDPTSEPVSPASR